MIILTGNSLGERQKELNVKVNEAVSKETNFDSVKTQIENSDVDRLFKIDLASKYENVEYILDTLKCGDSLYISRALQCIWLYNDEHSNVINTNFLQNNIFPFMSMRMKKKLLVTISMYVKNDRAISFYTYCMNIKLENIASKFLIFAPESFKLAIINEEKTLTILMNKKKDYIKQFVGNSFVLAESYLENKPEYQRIQVLLVLRHLYSVSEVKYLDLIEKYSKAQQMSGSKLGLRISKDIMTKHKERVRISPLYYLNILPKTMLVKHSTIDDAKVYIKALLPPKPSTFWERNFYWAHERIIALIPFEERLQFLKNLFTDSFPGEEFEMNFNFYDSKYYKLMTTEEREIWALRHIDSGLEMLGSGNDFKWYRFVNFEKAFVEIKKFIFLASNADSRAEIIGILVESAKNDQDLEKLFHYYYQRHVNEKQHLKECFIDKVLKIHNVYEFSDSCWTAFNKLFYSLEIYSDAGYHGSKTEYSMIALIYNIIHDKDVPVALKKFIDSGMYYYLFKMQTNLLNAEKEDIVYQYMLKFYLDRFTSAICASDDADEEDNKKEIIRKYIHFVLDLMSNFNKPKEDIPDNIKKNMTLDWDEFKKHKMFCQEKPKNKKISRVKTQEILLGLLKKNTNLLLSKLAEIEEKIKDINYYSLKWSKLLKKIKVYFSHDVAKVFTNFFVQLPYKSDTLFRLVIAAAYGIFQVADEKSKIEYMIKYVPTEPKIDRSTIDEKLLYTQQAICRAAYYSRPPVPLSNILSYIKGDYVHYCFPMFHSYLVNLPLPLCIEFTKSILDAPVSIQKHGLRLAFQCFSSEDLSKLILNVWEKTKNVSLREVIYKALYAKILKEDEHAQKTLFEVLKKLTLDLHEEDCDQLFVFVTSNNLPDILIADYLGAAWQMINKPTQKQTHIERRTKVIYSITNKMQALPNDFLQSIIDDHLESALDEKLMCDKKSNTSLIAAKWQLTAKYLAHYTSQEDVEKKVALAQSILQKCIKMWNVVNERIYVVKKFCYQFMSDLDSQFYIYDMKSMAQGNFICKQILIDLQDAFPIKDMYVTIWNLRMSIITRSIQIESKSISKLNGDAPLTQVIEEGVLEFGKQFANLIIEFKGKGTYYASFFEGINSILNKKLLRLLEHYLSSIRCGMRDSRFRDAQVLLCAVLLEFNMFETYMFAVKTLPIDYSDKDCYFVKYKTVISKIKQFENNDVQFYMYNKFNDFKYRDFLEDNFSN